MKPYRDLFFDLDGTLTNPKEGITRSVEYALNAFGISVPDRDALCRFIGPPLVESFQTYYGFSPQQAQKALLIYRERFAKTGIWENEPYHGMEELLKALWKAGRRLTVATSKPTVFAEQILERFGYRKYFTAVSGSELDGTHNQKREVIQSALAFYNLAPHQALMVGDTRYDVEGAALCGLDCVGVLYGFGSRQELEAAGAVQLADSVPALRRLLLGEAAKG